MAEENIAESLAAVEKALEHFNTSLIRSGFADGAASYQKMAEIIVGQWMWASSQGIDQHNDRFRRVAALAAEIHEQLLPYVEGMRKLALLQELVPEPKPEPPFPPDSRPARILEMLAAAPRPMSMTALRKEVGGSSSVLKKELAELVSDGWVRERRAGSRVLYALSLPEQKNSS